MSDKVVLYFILGIIFTAITIISIFVVGDLGLQIWGENTIRVTLFLTTVLFYSKAHTLAVKNRYQ